MFSLRINRGTKLNSLKISITLMRECGNTEEPYKMRGKSVIFLIFPCIVLLIFPFLNWKILTESRAHHIGGLVMTNRLQLNLCLQFEWTNAHMCIHTHTHTHIVIKALFSQLYSPPWWSLLYRALEEHWSRPTSWLLSCSEC